MGQYFKLVNLDKKEYINPLDMDSGMEYWEMIKSIPHIWWFLLRKSDGTGGGDVGTDIENVGRWVGDRVMALGDYDSSDIWDELSAPLFTNISSIILVNYKEFCDEIRKLEVKD